MNDKSFLFQRQTECHERRVVRFGIDECPDTSMFTHIRCCVAKCTLPQHMWRKIYIPSNSLLPVHLFQHHTPTSLKFNTVIQFFSIGRSRLTDVCIHSGRYNNNILKDNGTNIYNA